MTNGGEKVVEVKQLPLTPDDFRDIRAVLSDALRAMAYSLRGNNDVAYKILLLLYQEDLDRVAKPQQTEIFHLAQDLAQPYWDEFGYDRRGYERFQIWIEAGRPKATPTFLLDRFWRWGEDGTVNRTFGEVEYNALLAASAAGERNKIVRSNEPMRSTRAGIAFWEGRPHLAKARALETRELCAVPRFLTQPFFSGFITPSKEEPFLSWGDALHRESAVAQQFFPSHVAQYMPRSSAGGEPLVRLHVATDRETYMAPGGALYAFAVAAKADRTTHFAYQPTTQDSTLTERRLREARLHGGVQTSGKYLIWRTADSDSAISPKPGLPFGPYYSMAWIYSGLLRRCVERVIDSGQLSKADTLAEQQSIIDAALGALPFETANPGDELEAVEPTRFAATWKSVKGTGLMGFLRRRVVSSPISNEVMELYRDSFASQLAATDNPPLELRRVPVIERPDGKPIVNLVRNVQRDFGSR